jgi:hypothetical protein
MPASTPAIAPGAERIGRFILVLRRQRVLHDEGLAALYGVETRALLQAVKRNSGRFPLDFMFELSAAEWAALKMGHIMRTNCPLSKLTAPRQATDFRVGACRRTGSLISGGTDMRHREPCCWK